MASSFSRRVRCVAASVARSPPLARSSRIIVSESPQTGCHSRHKEASLGEFRRYLSLSHWVELYS